MENKLRIITENYQIGFLQERYTFCEEIPFISDIKRLSDIRVCYPDAIKKEHTHDFYVILWFVTGAGDHIVDNKTYEIKANRIFFLRPGQVHSFRNVKHESGISIAFSEKIFGEFSASLVQGIKQNIFCKNSVCAYCDVSYDLQDSLVEKTKEMTAEYQDLDPVGQQLFATHLLAFLLELIKKGKCNCESKKDYVPRSHQVYLDFKCLVEQHFHDKHCVKWYANRLNISEALLHKYVHAESNHTETPLSIIRNRLLVDAIYKLSNTTQSVKEISDELGFVDASYFAKFFKTMQGISPTDYRDV